MEDLQIFWTGFIDLVLKSSWLVQATVVALLLLAVRGFFTLLRPRGSAEQATTFSHSMSSPSPRLQPRAATGGFNSEQVLSLEASLLSELQRLLQQDRKIEAIKLLRERTGASLVEAKNGVEIIEARFGKR